MVKHTPGPWVNQEGPYFINARALSGVVADIRLAGGVITAEDRANARLIAAAPDLLNMCERLLGFARHYGSTSGVTAGEAMLANAKTLIAHAKGGAA